LSEKIWFITGASRGLGREWARAALTRGDKVAAAARDTSTLRDLHGEFGDSLLPITLDVTNRAHAFAAVAHTHNHFGRLDVVVNNAGYGHMGFVEEVSENEARAQMETNFFGALWVTQAALPYFRGQRYGHIIQVSSAGGLVALPDFGLYCASKFALEGLSEALAYELDLYGIHVTLVEPGPFATDFPTASAKHSTPLPPYLDAHEKTARSNADIVGEPGDPRASAEALLTVVDAETPPLRVLFGARSLSIVRNVYGRRLSDWEEWESVAALAQGQALSPR
jgi:NAD(P)-dependent dehydrogenase (short-subunit alcohol dehydrogenase family)